MGIDMKTQKQSKAQTQSKAQKQTFSNFIDIYSKDTITKNIKQLESNICQIREAVVMSKGEDSDTAQYLDSMLSEIKKKLITEGLLII
jgi:hypothetical protein